MKNITLKKNVKKLHYYLDYFFSNLYSCYIEGIGYDILKSYKKTEYRLKNNIQELGFILQKEDSSVIKEFFLNELLNLVEKKNENKRLLKKKLY